MIFFLPYLICKRTEKKRIFFPFQNVVLEVLVEEGLSEMKKKFLPHFMLFCLLLSGLEQDQLSKVIGSVALKETPPLGYA